MPASASLCLCVLVSSVCRAEPPFRTDSTPPTDKTPWYQLKPGEFPPENSAHYLAGELIALDHVNRTATLRPDRTDAIRRGDWDKPMPFTILPYGSLAYHGAAAELRDIPIGTHLHGLFYADEKPAKDFTGPFTRCLRLEDDFSVFTREKRSWHIDSIDPDKQTLTVTGASDSKPTTFQLTPAARIWKGHGFGEPKDLAPGQPILLNLTVCTLKGPGRITDAWLDDEARKLATAHQLEVHRQFIHEHGLPGWIDAIDNQQGTVTATLFDGFDPTLLNDFTVKESLTACVAGESLRTYDQINDRMRGEILDIQKTTPTSPGDSGARITFKPANLLEGFRPKHILRLFAGKWKVDDLPREERLYQ